MQIKPFVFQVEKNLDTEENTKKNPRNQTIGLGSSEILFPESAELVAKVKSVGGSAPTGSKALRRRGCAGCCLHVPGTEQGKYGPKCVSGVQGKQPGLDKLNPCFMA